MNVRQETDESACRIEAELEEIVKMVGMDALSATGQTENGSSKIHSERTSCIRTHSMRVDTYTSLNKQYHDDEISTWIFYNEANEALDKWCVQLTN